MECKLFRALLAVYQDIELQNVEGGSAELNILVQEALEAYNPSEEANNGQLGRVREQEFVGHND